MLSYPDRPKFNSVYLWNNLPKLKDWVNVINLAECESIGTHWIAFYVNGNNATYSDRFGVEHIAIKIKKFIRNKNTTNIYRKQAYSLIICLVYWFDAER